MNVCTREGLPGARAPKSADVGNFLSRTVAAMVVAAVVQGAAASALAGQPGVVSQPGAWHGHHVWRGAHAHGAWRGGAAPSVGAGVPPPPELPPITAPPRPYGGCLPTAPRYNSYGAYVAGGC